jgi:hypothetical protein
VVAENNARPWPRGVGHGGVSGEARVRCDDEVLDHTNGAAVGRGQDICGSCNTLCYGSPNPCLITIISGLVMYCMS